MKIMGISSFSSSKFLFTTIPFANGGTSSSSTTFLSSSLLPLSQSTHFRPLSASIHSNRWRAFASNKGRKGGGATTLIETGGSEDEDNDEEDDELVDFIDEFDGGGDGDDDDDEGVFVPLEQMKKWLESKPRGFGEGKVYDTSIEDKLFDEIQQSKKAQLVNVNNLKNNLGSKKDDDKNKKVAEGIASGIRVRVANLPKKKNIHRDLKVAFNGVSGIINISPAVSGNKKTKDPVCKGFAYVDFKREVDANRFVETFSGETLMFGRIQKQIKCEMTDSVSITPANNGPITPKVAIPLLEDSLNTSFDMKNSSSALSVEIVSDEVEDQDDEFVSDEFDDDDDELLSDEFDDEDDEFDVVDVDVGEDRNNINASSEAEASGADIMEPTSKATADLTPLERIRALEKKLLARGKQQRVPKEEKAQKLERVKPIKKKVVAKGKQQKVPKEQKVQKLDIPGSAKRLKIKEKAKLTEVFSKYGLKTSLNSKEES